MRLGPGLEMPMPGCLPFRVRWLLLIAIAVCVASFLSAAPTEPTPASFLVQPYLQLPTPTSIRVMWETNQELPGAVEYGQTPELGQVLRVGVPSELHELCLTDLKPA